MFMGFLASHSGVLGFAEFGNYLKNCEILYSIIFTSSLNKKMNNRENIYLYLNKETDDINKIIFGDNYFKRDEIVPVIPAEIASVNFLIVLRMLGLLGVNRGKLNKYCIEHYHFEQLTLGKRVNGVLKDVNLSSLYLMLADLNCLNFETLRCFYGESGLLIPFESIKVDDIKAFILYRRFIVIKQFIYKVRGLYPDNRYFNDIDDIIKQVEQSNNNSTGKKDTDDFPVHSLIMDPAELEHFSQIIDAYCRMNKNRYVDIGYGKIKASDYFKNVIIYFNNKLYNRPLKLKRSLSVLLEEIDSKEARNSMIKVLRRFDKAVINKADVTYHKKTVTKKNKKNAGLIILYKIRKALNL